MTQINTTIVLIMTMAITCKGVRTQKRNASDNKVTTTAKAPSPQNDALLLGDVLIIVVTAPCVLLCSISDAAL